MPNNSKAQYKIEIFSPAFLFMFGKVSGASLQHLFAPYVLSVSGCGFTISALHNNHQWVIPSLQLIQFLIFFTLYSAIILGFLCCFFPIHQFITPLRLLQQLLAGTNQHCNHKWPEFKVQFGSHWARPNTKIVLLCLEIEGKQCWPLEVLLWFDQTPASNPS